MTLFKKMMMMKKKKKKRDGIYFVVGLLLLSLSVIFTLIRFQNDILLLLSSKSYFFNINNKLDNTKNYYYYYYYYSPTAAIIREGGDDSSSDEDDDDEGSSSSSSTTSKKKKKKQINNTTTTTTTTTTLWLITCETREDNKDLTNWLYTAEIFKQKNSEKEKRRSNTTKTKVEIVNVCKNKEWQYYFLSKFYYTFDFLNSLDSSNDDDLLIFTDSDTIFNSMYWTADDVIQRFNQIINYHNTNSHHKQQQQQQQQQSRKIVISAEPACWIGKQCTINDLQTLYPHSQRSNCPQFVNSGQYGGYVTDIKQMLDEILNYKDIEIPGPSPLDDQARLTLWYSKQQQSQQQKQQNSTTTTTNSNMILEGILDTTSTLFRSMLFGLIDKNIYIKKDGVNCGGGGNGGSSRSGNNDTQCGRFQKPINDLGGYVVNVDDVDDVDAHNNNNNNTNDTTTTTTTSSSSNSIVYIEMYPVPECENAYLRPFSMHGNGPSKYMVLNKLSDRFVKQLKEK